MKTECIRKYNWKFNRKKKNETKFLNKSSRRHTAQKKKKKSQWVLKKRKIFSEFSFKILFQARISFFEIIWSTYFFTVYLVRLYFKVAKNYLKMIQKAVNWGEKEIFIFIKYISLYFESFIFYFILQFSLGIEIFSALNRKNNRFI